MSSNKNSNPVQVKNIIILLISTFVGLVALIAFFYPRPSSQFKTKSPIDNPVQQDMTWKFKQPKNLAVITLSRILEGESFIKIVNHGTDGYWEFLDGEDIETQDASVVSFEEIVQFDPTLETLFELPAGYQATRENQDQEWVISKQKL